MLNCDFQNWLALVVTILSVWRLTSLLCYEAGPFGVLSRLRGMLYRMRLGSIIECFHCLSVWVAAVLVLFVYQLQPTSLLLIFATAGGASIIERTLSQ